MPEMNAYDRRELLKRAADDYQYCLDAGWPYAMPRFDLFQCGKCGLLAPTMPAHPRRPPRECFNRDCRSSLHWIDLGVSDDHLGRQIATQLMQLLLAAVERGVTALPPNRVPQGLPLHAPRGFEF